MRTQDPVPVCSANLLAGLVFCNPDVEAEGLRPHAVSANAQSISHRRHTVREVDKGITIARPPRK